MFARTCLTHLGNGCCKDDYLVQFSDPFHEGVNTGSFDDIDIMVLSFYLDRDSEVGLVEDLLHISERSDRKSLQYSL